MTNARVRSGLWLMSGVALTLVTTTVFNGITSSAAPGPNETTFVPVAPCRLFDYRPAPDTVGPRPAPLGANETATQQVTGAVGNCNVPADATGVAMNVTIVGPTAASFLTIYPSDLATRPTASNLNWAAGQTATPNKVDVKLSPTGAVKIYNRFGSVSVLADVVGYYTRSGIEDLDARIAALESGRVIAASAHRDNVTPTPPGSGPILTTTIEAPVAGTIQIIGTVYTYGNPDATATCRLSHNDDASGDMADTDRPYFIGPGSNAHCATSGAVAVDPGTHVIRLVASIPAGGGIEDASLDALFVPAGTVVDFGTGPAPTGAADGSLDHLDTPDASGSEG